MGQLQVNLILYEYQGNAVRNNAIHIISEFIILLPSFVN